MSGALYEVSWEVCHKVGGIHTVVSSKARTLVARRGDDYLMVGPWLLSEGNAEKVLDPDPAFDAFAEGCRAAGVPVRVGRWRIPGAPRTVLVEFSGLYAKKDQILGTLWTRDQVDSLFGGWDYIEPVLFGHAAGIVVERWHREFGRGPAVAQFHEWMTGAGLLHLRAAVPEIGTVFTSHATVLGRALAATGKDPIEGLDGRTPAAAAEALEVRGKHSMEGAVSRAADVLTTVSAATGEELRVFHGRAPDVLLPNGIDVESIASAAAAAPPDRARETLLSAASRFVGEPLDGARMVVAAARYEFVNKGFDLLLASAAALAARPGPRVVLWFFVPAHHLGVRREVAERLSAGAASGGPLGVTTHQLADGDADPIVRRCAELGLTNAPGSRVKVVFVPVYLHGDDGVLQLPYESVLRAVDLTAFPSAYDAWGYTPQESLALGVPTVTTDSAGFGVWVSAEGLGAADGVHVLARKGRTFDEARDALATLLHDALAGGNTPELSERCVAAAGRTSWSALVTHYDDAFAAAAKAAAARPAASRARQRAEVRGTTRPARPTVFPLDATSVLPPALAALSRLAANWRFTWDPEVAALFAEISPATWSAVRGNPVRLLREAPQGDLDARAADSAYLRRLKSAAERTAAALAAPVAAAGQVTAAHPVAYICAEYGLAECLPIYSGGLGILAGDHLRAASDLGVPLVAIGMLYRRGYMRQRLQGGVEQVALVEELDPRVVPLTLVTDASGAPVEVEINLPATTLHLRAWRADVGRVALYLLDSDVDANRPEDRGVTHSLYGGDEEYRVRQEIVLGRGGVRLLAKLGIDPSVFHINEGHGAFVVVERALRFVRAGLTFDEARDAVRASTVFTTHTPVPAGHDVFDEGLMRRHFSHTPERLGLSWERFFALGASPDEPGFNMTHLALRFAGFVNGVSRLHAEVSRGLLRPVCPHLTVEEVPVTSVTNGVHLSAWTSAEMAALLTGGGRPVAGSDFAKGDRVPLDALWNVRSALRRGLRERVAAHLRRSFEERDDSRALLDRILERLAEPALYVGFARRFATYKRADLMLRDPARFSAMLDSEERPVRVLIAGKAHPRDHAAKELLAKVARLSRTDEFAGRLVVLENYDAGLARTLVQGVDVWLNTPRRPMEASGTSGMKAAANGALNVSIGDGWWPEGYAGDNGWLVGGDAPAAAADAVRDEVDSASLYRILEEEVVPLFFKRDDRGVPRAWIERVRRSLATIPPVFDAARMVGEYRDLAYAPLAARSADLFAGHHAALRAGTAQTQRIAAGLASARICAVSVGTPVAAGRVAAVDVEVDLGTLSPAEVVVEFVVGRRDGADLRGARVIELAPQDGAAGTARRFGGSFTPEGPASLGYCVRVRGRRPAAFDEPAVWV